MRTLEYNYYLSSVHAEPGMKNKMPGEYVHPTAIEICFNVICH